MIDTSTKLSALIDASLFLAHILEDKKHKNAVSKFRDDIKMGLYEVVISYPVLVEIVGAFARNQFDNWKERIKSNMMGMNDQQKREKYLNEFLDRIQESVNKDIEELITALKSAPGFRLGDSFSIEMDEEVLKFMKKYIGKIRDNEDIALNTLGFADIFHVLTAHKLGCRYLITADQGFERIKNDDPFLKKLSIRVYKEGKKSVSS